MASTGVALGLTLLAFGCGGRTSLDDAPPMGSTASGGEARGTAGGADSSDVGGAGGAGGAGGGTTSCGDTQYDAANCGACGVRCKGKCELGRCAITFASGLQEAGCVAVDGESVYWVTGAPGPDFPGAVMKAPLEGGPVTTLAAGIGFPWPCHIALDRTNVYWGGADADGIRKVPLRGGAMTIVVGGSSAAGGLAVDATSAYFTSDYGDVSKVPLAGGPIQPLAMPGGTDLAIDARHVYWTTRTGGQTSDLMRATLDGSAVTKLASSLMLADVLAIDARDVYVAEYLGGTVLAIPLGGGPARTVTSKLFNPDAIALDDQNVYVATGLGQLMRAPKSGGTSTLLAQETNIFSIAVDASSVYWTNGDAVKKVSKR
jgi:hypothetical protein